MGDGSQAWRAEAKTGRRVGSANEAPTVKGGRKKQASYCIGQKTGELK